MNPGRPPITPGSWRALPACTSRPANAVRIGVTVTERPTACRSPTLSGWASTSASGLSRLQLTTHDDRVYDDFLPEFAPVAAAWPVRCVERIRDNAFDSRKKNTFSIAAQVNCARGERQVLAGRPVDLEPSGGDGGGIRAQGQAHHVRAVIDGLGRTAALQGPAQKRSAATADFQ